MLNQTIADREAKYKKIIDEYNKRKTQQEVADKFDMTVADVAQITRDSGYKHTRKVTEENRRNGEIMKPIICYDDEIYKALDKYPMENFL